jgi:hypothetical protein
MTARRLKGGVLPAARNHMLRTVRGVETIDAELQLVAALRHAARERGGPLPSIDVADALLDERRGLAELGNQIAPVRV